MTQNRTVDQKSQRHPKASFASWSQGLGFRVEGLGFRVLGVGFGV